MRLLNSCILLEKDYTISTIEKIKDRFCRNPIPSDFEWSDFEKLMSSFGYKQIKKGGARRIFHNESTNHIIRIHEPHGADSMIPRDIRRVRKKLEEQGCI